MQEVEEKDQQSNSGTPPLLNPNATAFISFSTQLYGPTYPCAPPVLMTEECPEAADRGTYPAQGFTPALAYTQNAGVGFPQSTCTAGGCAQTGAGFVQPLPQHYPTLSLCATYPPNISTQSSPEVRGYPIAGLSDLSPPPWKHDLQSTCSEDSALHSDSDNLAPPTNLDQHSLVARVRKQLEYYFSLDNLATDQYLISQMDGDQFVPIWTVANFNAVKKLTTDIDVIKEALHSSTEVQIDSTGSKVRPVIKRCTLILRDISPHATPQEIAGLFSNSPDCPACVKCTFVHNSSWFVEFRTEHEALQAYSYFREHPHYFHGHLIKVRIKAKPIQRSSPTDGSPVSYNSSVYQGTMPCYPMLPMMWMSPGGVVPVDMPYPPGYSGEYPDPLPEEHRYRIRSEEAVNHSGGGRKKSRRNNSNRSNWRNGERDRFQRHRHKRNDSDDSSTVSSASSYHVPQKPVPGKPRPSTAPPSKPVPINNPPSSQNKSGPPLQPVPRLRGAGTHRNFGPRSHPAETEVVPTKIQTSRPTEPGVEFEPSQFPPLNPESTIQEVRSPTPWCRRANPAAWPAATTPETGGCPRVTPVPSRGPSRGSKRPTQFVFRDHIDDGEGRRPENHMSSENAISWRRGHAKNIRGMRSTRKRNTGERREGDFIPDVPYTNQQEDETERPTYSQITRAREAAAAIASVEQTELIANPSRQLTNGLIDSTSSGDDCVVYRKTFSDVISANGPTDTFKRRSESSDHSVGSPMTPKNELCKPDEEHWTKPRYRSSRPRNNVNVRNVYRLESKLDDLDISESAFPPTNHIEESVFASSNHVRDSPRASVSSADLATPCNEVTVQLQEVITSHTTPSSSSCEDTEEAPEQPTTASTWGSSRQHVNWFEDDEEDLVEFGVSQGTSEQFGVSQGTSEQFGVSQGTSYQREASEQQLPNGHVVQNHEMIRISEKSTRTHLENGISDSEQNDPRDDPEMPKSDTLRREIPVCGEFTEKPTATLTDTLEPHPFSPKEVARVEGNHVEDAENDSEEQNNLFEDSVGTLETVKRNPAIGSLKLADINLSHDSEYDSERDEFYSSYCESPGWE